MSASTATVPAAPLNVLYGEMIIDDDDDGEEGATYVSSFAFEYSAGGVRINFSIDPSTTAPQEWTEFVRKVRAGESAEVATGRCNGEVAISHDRGIITLRTSRHGAGGDGGIDVGFDAAISIDAIDACARAFAAHGSSGGTHNNNGAR